MRFFLLLALAAPLAAQPADRWEPKIAEFEQMTKKKPPKPGGIVFYGSSSIVRWDLKKAFPDLPAINRGFGGSTMADALRYVDRVVIPLKPRLVVLYEGDNDIGRGITPPIVVHQYKQLVAKIHKSLPDAKIAFVAIKPSLRRAHLISQVRGANLGIREVTEQDERLSFIDIETPMLGSSGSPARDLFVEDLLHLSPKGYAMWNKVTRPYLEP